MAPLDRRTYLKASLGSAAVAAGIAGVGSAMSDGISMFTVRSGAKNECVPPNILLAKFEWDDNDRDGDPPSYQFEVEEGDESAVEIYDIEYKDDDQTEPVAFKWRSDRPVCVASVKTGTKVIAFQGGMTGGKVDVRDVFDNLDKNTKSISNAIFCVRPAQGLICEGDMTNYEGVTHLDGDPGNEGRTDVVHAVSRVRTNDYIHGIVDLRTQYGKITLSDLSTLSFDYFEGLKNTDAAPDETFVVLGQENDGGFLTKVSLAVKTVNDDIRGADRMEERWWTLDLTKELAGDGIMLPDRTWSALDITDASLNNEGPSPSKDIRNLALELRNNEDLEFSAAVDAFGRDPIVLAVGFGAGLTSRPGNERGTIIDRYYDALTVDDGSGAETFGFPAAIPTTLSLSRVDDEYTATLETTQEEQDFDFNNVSKRSVKLTARTRVAPPAERGTPGGKAVVASSVTAEGMNTLTAEFPTSEVKAIGLDSDDPVFVSGDLTDTGQVISFFGTGKLPE